MAKVLKFVKYGALLVAAVMAGLAFAQATAPDLTRPSTWFESQEVLFLAVGMLVSWLTKIITALGKDWFSTEGRATQWLSLIIAALLGGVGGFLGLGYFAGATGGLAAIQAAALTAFAFLVSNGMAKNDRQVATAAAVRTAEALRK